MTRNNDALMIEYSNSQAFMALCGERDANLRRVEEKTGATLHVRGNQIALTGSFERVVLAKKVLQNLYEIASKGNAPLESDVDKVVAILTADPSAPVVDILSNGISMPTTSIKVYPKTPNQRHYMMAMQKHEIVFAVGPAGTGKTFLAMAMALSYLLSKKVNKIVLTRPAVEAGERLGFLPGDLAEKVNPYLRPLYDALYELLDYDKGAKLIERSMIEIAPLAFMRGRTLSHSWVILDEAQNCTIEQMKMFLTRLGEGSRAVVTGDITQSDLPPDKQSGLAHAITILENIKGIAFCHFDERDVMRHPVVAEILKAYEADRLMRRQNGSIYSKQATEDKDRLEGTDPVVGKGYGDIGSAGKGGNTDFSVKPCDSKDK